MPALLKFFGFTFLLTWTSWASYALLSGKIGHAPASRSWLSIPILYTGIFAPAIVALFLTARSEGQPGVERLLKRVVAWKAGAQWYAFAIFYMAVIKLVGAVLHRVITGAWPQFGQESWLLMLVATFASVMIGGQTGEEIGWRGYALPRLAERMGFAWASVLLGVIWATWHLPLFLIPGTNLTNQSFPLYLIQVTAISVAITWVYVHTEGSLLLTMLLHSAVNNTKDIVPSAIQGATNTFALSSSLMGRITALLLWVCAAYFLVRMPKPSIYR